MMHPNLSEDTQAILLLCGVFGKSQAEKPLSLSEYSSLVRWLIRSNLRPADLLRQEAIESASQGSGMDPHRLKGLMARGVQLGFAVEEWQQHGIWIISRSDAEYPSRLKKHLRDKAPPLLFGIGNHSLLDGGGLAMVGSRNVDQIGEAFARQVAALCAQHHLPVVSGGARGVDQVSMSAALEAGGPSIGILADSLLKKSLDRRSRQAFSDGRLLLLSPYHPNAHFTVGTAMGRNKLIYAMADYGLVVSAEYQKGGTWAGAQEELGRKSSRPVFVRIDSNTPQGNARLLELGAIPWPESIIASHFPQQLAEQVAKSRAEPHEENLNLFDLKGEESLSTKDKAIPQGKRQAEEGIKPRPAPQSTEPPTTIYQAVLPIILGNLTEPISSDELAQSLKVTKGQLNEWLKQALAEKKIQKLTKPTRYQRPSRQ